MTDEMAYSHYFVWEKNNGKEKVIKSVRASHKSIISSFASTYCLRRLIKR